MACGERVRMKRNSKDFLRLMDLISETNGLSKRFYGKPAFLALQGVLFCVLLAQFGWNWQIVGLVPEITEQVAMKFCIDEGGGSYLLGPIFCSERRSFYFTWCSNKTLIIFPRTNNSFIIWNIDPSNVYKLYLKYFSVWCLYNVIQGKYLMQYVVWCVAKW